MTLSTLLYALLFSSLITLSLYVKQGLIELDGAVIQALLEIFLFWFPISWSVALLIALFLSIKHIFNTRANGYVLELLNCPKENKEEKIDIIGYGDLVKVWRKWLMLLIWLVGIEMVVVVSIMALVSVDNALFSWFNIYVLYTFIIIAGYFSFIILSLRCKKVRLVKC